MLNNIIKYDNGDIYKGGINVNGRSHGFGILNFVNGDIYEGEFNGGHCFGNGEYKFKCGDRIKGQFKYGRLYGNGVKIFVNGDIYEGKFKNTLKINNPYVFFGEGTYKYNNGRNIINCKNWKDNNRANGKGYKIIYNDDLKSSFKKYTGSFLNDQYNGKGEETFNSNNRNIVIKRGTWDQGVFIEGKQIIYHNNDFSLFIHFEGKNISNDIKNIYIGTYIVTDIDYNNKIKKYKFKILGLNDALCKCNIEFNTALIYQGWINKNFLLDRINLKESISVNDYLKIHKYFIDLKMFCKTGSYITSKGKYNGHWNDGIFQGKFIGKDIEYSGMMKVYYDNTLMFNGVGSLSDKYGTKTGFFKDGLLNGRGIVNTNDGRSYSSDNWVSGKINGEGKYYHYYQGETTEFYGTFKDNKFSLGEKKIIFTNNSSQKYYGDFDDNEKETGKNKIEFSDGGKYIGNFSEGSFNGDGIYIYPNNEIYQGQWKDGLKNGKGRYTWTNKAYQEGIWINDEEEGETFRHEPNGEVWKEVYNNGKLVSEDKIKDARKTKKRDRIDVVDKLDLSNKVIKVSSTSIRI